MRGRIDSAGKSATASGTLYKGSYRSGGFSGYPYIGTKGYIYDDWSAI